MKAFLGIDPGLQGAIALYDPIEDDLSIWDMPLHAIRVSGKVKGKLDLAGLHNIMAFVSENVKKAALEEVNAMPKQGVTSSFNFGWSAGATEMALAANQIPYTTIRPAIWKREMGLTADKDGSRREASRLMPQHARLWTLVKHDGRAEAALLAYYLSKRE